MLLFGSFKANFSLRDTMGPTRNGGLRDYNRRSIWPLEKEEIVIK